MTLVTTSVEGASELADWDSGAMAEARKTHDGILRSQLRRFHGYAQLLA